MHSVSEQVVRVLATHYLDNMRTFKCVCYPQRRLPAETRSASTAHLSGVLREQQLLPWTFATTRICCCVVRASLAASNSETFYSLHAAGVRAQNDHEFKDDHVHSAYKYRVRMDHCTQGGVTITVLPMRS